MKKTYIQSNETGDLFNANDCFFVKDGSVTWVDPDTEPIPNVTLQKGQWSYVEKDIVLNDVSYEEFLIKKSEVREEVYLKRDEIYYKALESLSDLERLLCIPQDLLGYVEQNPSNFQKEFDLDSIIASLKSNCKKIVNSKEKNYYSKEEKQVANEKLSKLNAITQEDIQQLKAKLPYYYALQKEISDYAHSVNFFKEQSLTR